MSRHSFLTMKVIQGIILIIGVVFYHSVAGWPEGLRCEAQPVVMSTEWASMVDPCTWKMQEHVRNKLTASLTYMAMGAHFARDTVNRPGFSKMFFESASEEREHAIKIIEYLLMRGGRLNIPNLIQSAELLRADYKQYWDTGLSALTAALQLETSLTKDIRDVIKACEDHDAFNDYHLVDYLTGDFLKEQYRSQRYLAGKISSLSKMMVTHGELGDFLFDKKLLSGALM